MKCPVCDNVNMSMLCPECGFDSSRDYEKYPTFGPVGRVPSASGLRVEWKGPVKVPVWLMAAACVLTMVLGIGIGAGLGGGEYDPTEPKETVQMQEPQEPWEVNILMSDEVRDGVWCVEAPVFGSKYRREQIKTVTFLDTLADEPQDAWDVSEAGNGAVMAWVKRTDSLSDVELDQYDLYVGAEGGVWGGESCEELFAGYKNAERIVFADVFHTENVQNMSHLFLQCHDLTSLELSEFDTSNVQNMSGMFGGCKSLPTLDLSSFDTANVEYMGAMFSGCSSLSDLKVSRFDTSKVRIMNFMFKQCEKLSTLDLSSFDTSNVTQMTHMFEGCSSLEKLTLSNSFDTSNVYFMDWMFYGCSSLKKLTLGDKFVTTNADTTDMFDYCPAGEDYNHLLN